MTEADSPSFLKDWLLYIPTVLGPAILGMATVLILTRVLRPEELGQYALALVGATVAAAVLGDWLTPLMLRFHPEQDAQSAPRFLRSLGLLAIGLAAVAGLGTTVFTLPAVPGVYAFSAGVLALTLVLVKLLYAYLRAEARTSRFVWLSIASPLGALLTGLLLFSLLETPAAFLWGPSVINAVVIGFLVFDFVPATSGGKVLGRDKFMDMMRFGLPMTITSVGGQILLLGDRYLLNILRGPIAVGIYSPGYSLGEKFQGFAFSPIFNAQYPRTARLWGSGDESAAMELLGLSLRLTLLVGGFITMVLNVFAHDLVPVLLGEGYEGAAQVVGLIALATLLWNVAILSHQPLEMTKQTHIIALLGSGAAIVNVVLNIPLILRFGYVGAAWGTLLSYIAYVIAVRVLCLRRTGFSVALPISTMARVAVFCGLLWAIHRGLGWAPAAVVAAPLYFLWLVLTREDALISLMKRHPSRIQERSL